MGLHFLLSCTRSKLFETIGYLNSRQDRLDQLEKVIASDDSPHRPILSGGWKVPYFDRLRGLPGVVLKRWQMNAIMTVQSGLALTAPSGCHSTGINPALPGNRRTVSRYFNTCAVTVARVRQNCASAGLVTPSQSNDPRNVQLCPAAGTLILRPRPEKVAAGGLPPRSAFPLTRCKFVR